MCGAIGSTASRRRRTERLAMDANRTVPLLILIAAGLAFYHVGVEQHWFAGPDACTGASAATGSIEEFRARLMAQQPVRCDEPQWALFGVSLAGWNLLASAALVIFCLLALRAPALRGRAA